LSDDVVNEIKSDEQLLEWFELNIKSGIMCVDVEIEYFDGSLQFSPSKHRCHPKRRQTLIETVTTPCPPTQNERATNERELKMTQPQMREPQSPKLMMRMMY
jgi:hypothetical protein